jgi:aryl-alcohol dehydrogenase-like predicted oxidoreductase
MNFSASEVGFRSPFPRSALAETVCVSQLGLGTGRIASLGAALSRKESSRLIQTALDCGITTIDTADTYGSGDSERLIHYGLGSRRRESFLMTKAGFPYASWPSFLSPANQIAKKLIQRISPRQTLSRRYLVRAVERSLRRLGTNYVDAFFLHEPFRALLTPESWAALDQIRASGKSRMTGVSTADPAVLADGLSSGQVQIVQTPVSIQAEHSAEILRMCSEANIPVVANEVLRPRVMLSEHREIWTKILTSSGFQQDATVPALIAYAKLQPAVQCVLSGTKSRDHLLENLKSIEDAERFRPACAAMNSAFQ